MEPNITFFCKIGRGNRSRKPTFCSAFYRPVLEIERLQISLFRKERGCGNCPPEVSRSGAAPIKNYTLVIKSRITVKLL